MNTDNTIAKRDNIVNLVIFVLLLIGFNTVIILSPIDMRYAVIAVLPFTLIISRLIAIRWPIRWPSSPEKDAPWEPWSLRPRKTHQRFNIPKASDSALDPGHDSIAEPAKGRDQVHIIPVQIGLWCVIVFILIQLIFYWINGTALPDQLYTLLGTAVLVAPVAAWWRLRRRNSTGLSEHRAMILSARRDQMAERRYQAAETMRAIVIPMEVLFGIIFLAIAVNIIEEQTTIRDAVPHIIVIAAIAAIYASLMWRLLGWSLRRRRPDESPDNE